jgi:hypothetical protein
LVTRNAIFGSKNGDNWAVKSPPSRPILVAKNTQASNASRSAAESSMRFKLIFNTFKKEWIRRVVHMERRLADDEVSFPGDARKIALN